MNFKKVLLALAAFGALFVTSCKEIQDKPITPVNITVSSDYIEVDSVGGTYTVDLYSSTAWTAEIVISNPWGDEEKNFEADPWISVDPVAGSASIDTSDVKEITINVKENVSDSVLYQREVIIYFRSDNMIYATTTVHQMGGVLKPNADTGPKPVTVAEFLAAEESNQWYRLSGKVVGLYNTEYGNFNIEDETGSVLCYGLNLNATAGDKTFSQIGIGEGDNVTLVGRRSSYNGTPQVGDAYYAPLKVTVAEFLSAEIDDNQLYELTGIMEGPVNTEYGNFDITDESGSVYVYGLTSTVILGESNDKSFSTLGYVEGDTLTIVGTRGDYNGKPEVMGPAYAVRAKGGSPAPDPDPEPELTKATVAEVIAAEVSDDVWYELTGTITDVQNTEYGNIVIEDETGSILVYGLTKEWNGGSNDKSYSEIGLREGDIVTLGGTRDEYNGEPQVGGTAFYISHVQGEAPEILESTIKDFLAAEESDQWYRLSGKIVNLANSAYGNFDLVDEEGNSVYVYGLKVSADAGNQTFAETGLQEGDYVTLIGKRSSFEGEPQVGSAYYAAMIVTVEEFLAAEPGDDQLYHLVGTITNLAASNYGNFDLVDDSGSVYVYGLTSTPRIGMSNNQSFPELGYQDGDTVILVGIRDEYNGEPQVNGPAYAVRPKSN
jgi:DNA/RNA endonuclease YhcR with UshA esterase domain